MQGRGDEHGEGGLCRVGAHRILRFLRIGEDLGQRPIIPNRAREDEGHALGDEGVHDPLGHQPALDGRGDRADAPDGVDRPHVQGVTAFHPFPGARHPERRAEDRRFQVVHGHRVTAQHRAHVAVADEPDHVLPRPGVHQRGAHHPHDHAAALLFLAQELRQHRVIDGPLARHFGLHEAEFVGAVAAGKEPLGVDVNPVAAVLRRAHRNQPALRYLARLGDEEVVPGLADDHAVHARQARPAPRPAHLQVGGQVRGRKKTVGENSVGGSGLEARIRRTRERRRVEGGWSILEAGAVH